MSAFWLCFSRRRSLNSNWLLKIMQTNWVSWAKIVLVPPWKMSRQARHRDRVAVRRKQRGNQTKVRMTTLKAKVLASKCQICVGLCVSCRCETRVLSFRNQWTAEQNTKVGDSRNDHGEGVGHIRGCCGTRRSEAGAQRSHHHAPALSPSFHRSVVLFGKIVKRKKWSVSNFDTWSERAWQQLEAWLSVGGGTCCCPRGGSTKLTMGRFNPPWTEFWVGLGTWGLFKIWEAQPSYGS